MRQQEVHSQFTSWPAPTWIAFCRKWPSGQNSILFPALLSPWFNTQRQQAQLCPQGPDPDAQACVVCGNANLFAAPQTAHVAS